MVLRVGLFSFFCLFFFRTYTHNLYTPRHGINVVSFQQNVSNCWTQWDNYNYDCLCICKCAATTYTRVETLDHSRQYTQLNFLFSARVGTMTKALFRTLLFINYYGLFIFSWVGTRIGPIFLWASPTVHWNDSYYFISLLLYLRLVIILLSFWLGSKRSGHRHW